MTKGIKRGNNIGMKILFNKVWRIIYIILAVIISRTYRVYNSVKSNSPNLIYFGQVCIEAVLTSLIIALSLIVLLSQ